MGTKTKHSIALLLAAFLLINTWTVDGKRLFGGSSRKSSGSGGSRHTSSSTGSHRVSNPSSNHEYTRLSYANTHSQAPSHTNFGSSSTVNRGSSFGTNTHNQPSVPVSAPRPTVSPIGWNVPKNQGPPPAYSPSNPVGGAKTNLHESPPPYRPNTGSVHNPSAPPYPSAINSNTKPFTPAQTYRPRYNGTGGFGGSSNIHTPISATNAGHGVQSSYPRQQLPAGATYYPGGSSLPAGATYHPSGSVPHGATYYPTNSHVPQGAAYYPSSSHLPAGASYHPAGQVPQGAHYYPAGGVPAATHYPAAPAGATYLPAGAALPANAVYYAQPPKSSSGLGFGSGLAAGALGGALLGHVLTPSRTYSQPSYNPAPSQGHDDKVIIINNGPPGSVSTTNAGDGVTVINAGQPQAQPAQPAYQPAQPAYQPAQPAPAPAPAPAAQPALAALPASQTPLAALPAAQPDAPAPAAVSPVAQSAATPQVNSTDANAAVAQPTAEQAPPPPGGIICVPVKMQQPDPNDATKTIEVEQIACYPAPPPEATANSAVVPTDSNTVNTTTTVAPTSAPITTKDGVALAPLQSTSAPFVAPEGSVPLAPLNPSGQPDIMRMPGEPTVQHHSSSQAMLAPGSNLHVATNAASKYFDNFVLSSLLSLMLAFCLQ